MPPRVNEGRRIAGKPILEISLRPCSKLFTIILFGTLRPIFSMACLNFSLFSALSIDSTLAPINSTLYFSKIPSSSKLIAKFKAVWPPMVGRRASGFSLAIIFSNTSVVNGST